MEIDNEASRLLYLMEAMKVRVWPSIDPRFGWYASILQGYEFKHKGRGATLAEAVGNALKNKAEHDRKILEEI